MTSSDNPGQHPTIVSYSTLTQDNMLTHFLGIYARVTYVRVINVRVTNVRFTDVRVTYVMVMSKRQKAE